MIVSSRDRIYVEYGGESNFGSFCEIVHQKTIHCVWREGKLENVVGRIINGEG
jgi:hypothetical protein